VVYKLYDFISPIPVAAEDQLNRLGIVAYDGFDIVSSSEESDECDINTFLADSVSTTSRDVEGRFVNNGPVDSDHVDGESGGGSDHDQANENRSMDGDLNPNSDRGLERQSQNNNMNHESGGNEDEDDQNAMLATELGRESIPVLFVGRVNIKPCDGYRQVLEVAVIAAQMACKPRIENTVCMERVNVTATRMFHDAPTTSNAAQDGLPPYFATETTTITVGVVGGRCIGIRQESPTSLNEA